MMYPISAPPPAPATPAIKAQRSASPSPGPLLAAMTDPARPTPTPIPSPIRAALLADFETTRWTLSASARVTSVVLFPCSSVRAVSDTLVSLPFSFCPFLSRTDTSSPGGTALSPSQEPLIGVGVTCANVICGFANTAIKANATTTALIFLVFIIILQNRGAESKRACQTEAEPPQELGSKCSLSLAPHITWFRRSTA